MSTINAFISYSHQDIHMFETLGKHLTQLKRDGVITAWTDNNIEAGGDFGKQISASLATSKIFIALLSPDYIASQYCYELEFQKALEMQERGGITIVPIIVEPCDWRNTPFGNFKALPKDGKAVSLWENKNTAFLDVVQNLRKLAESSKNNGSSQDKEVRPSSTSSLKNYRVQKDFDSIEKIEFIEKTFREVKNYLNRYVAEIMQLDNIKVLIQNDNDTLFEALLVNRNKINTEAKLKVLINSDDQNNNYYLTQSNQIKYSIAHKDKRAAEKGFNLQFDDYHLFWAQTDFYQGLRNKQELDVKEITEMIWDEWLKSVGIM